MERALFSEGGLIFGAAAAVFYAFFAMGILTLDRFRASSTSKDDTQLELKVLLFALSLMGLFLACDGAASLVGEILGGFKGGGDSIKAVLPAIVVGAGVFAAVTLGLLPRTNTTTARGAQMLAMLVVGLYFGVTAIIMADGFVTTVVRSAPWSAIAGTLAKLAVDGIVGFIALMRLGSLAGWTAPVRPAAPPGYPPQGGGYPPQGGGYPPQGGGYPPQGGGYPPQGGGYPPQGGGYPPQGGGYPPQGGGGGGYQPR
jgi:hypothetical protein